MQQFIVGRVIQEKNLIPCEENFCRIFGSSLRDTIINNNLKIYLKVIYKDNLTHKISYNIMIADVFRKKNNTILTSTVRMLWLRSIKIYRFFRIYRQTERISNQNIGYDILQYSSCLTRDLESSNSVQYVSIRLKC